jgi:hypothetical protein
MNLNFNEFKNSDYDQERTFDFLQKVIAEKNPDWKEIVLKPKDFHISYEALPEFCETAASNLITFSLTAFEYLATDKREMLEKELWGTPYGYFYLWQYAINGLRYMDEDQLSLVQKYLDLLVDDLDKTPDCNAFNHFGRILAVIKFNIYCTITKTDKTNEIHQTFNRLMHKIQQYKENKVSKVAKGELALDNVKAEDCEQAIHFIDKLTGPYIASVGSYNLALLDKENRVKLASDIVKIAHFVDDLRYESCFGLQAVLFQDIDHEEHKIQMFIRYDMSMAESKASLAESKASLAESKASLAESKLRSERLGLSAIAFAATLHLPFPAEFFTQIEERNKSVVRVVEGRETDAIRYLLVNVSDKEPLVMMLNALAPTFYQAYLDSKK